MYSSNAERQAAYRTRVAERAELAGTGKLTGRLSQPETALAAAVRRADQAEARAARDRYAELLATRPARLAGAPGWAKSRVEGQLAAAFERVTELEATVAELRARLATTSGDASPTPGLNRAARRRPNATSDIGTDPARLSTIETATGG